MSVRGPNQGKPVPPPTGEAPSQATLPDAQTKKTSSVFAKIFRSAKKLWSKIGDKISAEKITKGKTEQKAGLKPAQAVASVVPPNSKATEEQNNRALKEMIRYLSSQEEMPEGIFRLSGGITQAR